MIRVTILTTPGATCSIQYRGPNGLSHAAGLEPQFADVNGICSWTWKQSIGNKLSTGLGLISIEANGDWANYSLTVQ
jgi:hypothetical protein